MRASILLLIMSLGWAASSRAESIISGLAVVLDGDTVSISGTSIRLQGIDTPETDQRCIDANGKLWSCGIDARDRLIAQTRGSNWSCRIVDHDPHGRAVGKCSAGGVAIERWLVSQGWALDYREYSKGEYAADEAVARERKAGLWAGAFIAPWEWRKRNSKTEIKGATAVSIGAQRDLIAPEATAGAPSADCVVKANFGSKSRQCIYHLRKHRAYGKMKMDRLDRRWFCTGAEAEAAGCRQAKR